MGTMKMDKIEQGQQSGRFRPEGRHGQTVSPLLMGSDGVMESFVSRLVQAPCECSGVVFVTAICSSLKRTRWNGTGSWNVGNRSPEGVVRDQFLPTPIGIGTVAVSRESVLWWITGDFCGTAMDWDSIPLVVPTRVIPG